MMIINEKMLSIPPYLSTSWRQVATLYLDEEKTLHVTLKSGITIAIPLLPEQVLKMIFNLHAQSVEKEEENLLPLISSEMLAKQISLHIDTDLLDMTSSFLQHDPQKADSPKIPEEIVKKLSLVASKLGPIDLDKLPNDEPHCNCPHCQIIRAIRVNENEHLLQDPLDEEVSDEDLRFCQWKIEEKSDKLFLVTNPLDHYEQYTVFLGDPIGCNCGKKGCEHLQAVLKS